MKARLLLTAAILGFTSAAYAQAPDARGSVPPGTAADGSRPADGAIKGGILPGESSGVPDRSPLPSERIKRCEELGGTLREECLMKEQDASTGGSSARIGQDATKGVAAPDAPPPQNPR